MTATTQETLSISGVMLAKLFGRQNQEIERFHTENQRLADLSVRLQMTGQSFFAVMQIFFSISPVVIYVIAGYLLTGSALGGVTAGTLVAFTTLQSRLFFPLGSLLQVSVELQASLALFERIFGYLDISPDIADSPGAVRMDPGKVRGRVSFESVRLSYGNERDNGSAGQRWALGGVSFHVEPGQLAAFVVPSVAGKTTISYMIPRLYDPTEGAVRIDGLDVREISLESLAPLTGYVTQESYCSTRALEATCCTGTLRRLNSRSKPPPEPPTYTKGSWTSPKATIRWSANAATGCPEANASGCP